MTSTKFSACSSSGLGPIAVSVICCDIIVAEDRMRTSDYFVDQRRDSDKDKLDVKGVYNEDVKSKYHHDDGYRQLPSILWLYTGSRRDYGDRQVTTRVQIQAASNLR